MTRTTVCPDLTDPMNYAALTPADWHRIESDTAELLARLLEYPSVTLLPVDVIPDLTALLGRLQYEHQWSPKS